MTTPTAGVSADPPRTSFAHLLATGALAAVVAVILALAALLIVHEVFDDDFSVRMGGADSEVLTVGAADVIVVTVLGAVGATVLYGLLARFRRRPRPFFQGIAAAFLFLSLAPVLTQPAGVTGATKAWLIAPHQVVAGAIVAVFTRRNSASTASRR